MPWLDMPLMEQAPAAALGAPTQIVGYPWWFQWWEGIRQRAIAVDLGPRWPRGSMVWKRFTITGVSIVEGADTIITAAAETWDTSGAPINVPWNSSEQHNPDPPASWSVVIHDCDDKRIIHAPILSWTTNSLTLPDQFQRITERVIPNAASLIGKQGFILAYDGIWPHERIPDWPNDFIFAQGKIASATATTIATGKAFALNAHAGDDVLYLNDAGLLRRGSITGNSTAGVLTFSGGSGIPTGDFYIVPAGGLFQLQRLPALFPQNPMWAWYQGDTEPFYTHWPDGSVHTVGKPKLQETYTSGPLCEPTPVTVFDNDFWTDANEVCFTRDHPFGPLLPKSFRFLQVMVEALINTGRWVDPTLTFDGVSIKPSAFSFASILHKADINAQASTTDNHTATGIVVELTVPWTPIEVYYEIRDENNSALVSGKGTYDGTEISGDFSAVIPGSDPVAYQYEGRTIIVSLGLSRWTPRWFLRRWDKTFWIPGLDPISGLPVDPPTADVPGTWQTKPKSTHYIDHTFLGFVAESSEERDAFADGDLARFVGDMWDGPGIDTGSGWLRADTPQPLKDYWNRAYVGQHSRAPQNTLNAQRSGKVISATTRSLTTDKHFFTDNWYTGGQLYEESGTATGGSNTSLTFSSTSGIWNPANGWMVGAVVQVLIGGVWHKRPVLTHSGTSPNWTITWDEALPSSASGKDFKMPVGKYERNRFKGRTLRIKNAAGAIVAQPKLDAEDDDTLFFPDIGLTPTADMTWEIIEESGVFKWSGGQWVIPTGADARGRTFHADSTENSENWVKRYGRLMLHDSMVFPTIYDEMYAILNLMTATIGDFGWVSRLDPAVAELNHEEVQSHLTSFFNLDPWKDRIRDPADAAWAGEATVSPAVWLKDERVEAPYAISIVGMTQAAPPGPSGDRFGEASLYRSYAYGQIAVADGDTCPLYSQTEFYAKAKTPTLGGLIVPAARPDLDTCGTVIDTDHYIFDPNGDAVQCHVFRLFSASSTDYPNGEGVTDRRSTVLGTLTEPDWPPSPPDPPGGPFPFAYGAEQGWVIMDKFQITRWTFNQMIDPDDIGEFETPDSPWFFYWHR